MNWSTNIEKARSAGPVLVWKKGFLLPLAAVWSPSIQEWVIFGSPASRLAPPTHWMPLPAAPVRLVSADA